MLSAPPKVGDILMYGEFDIQHPSRYGQSTFVVESISNGSYIIRLNSTSIVKRGVSLRHFIKKSSDKRIVTDADLANNYSDATDMLLYELADVTKRYFEHTGVSRGTI